MQTPAANKMGAKPADKHRQRWPRAVPAFDAELAAAERVRRAKAAGDPAAIAAAETAFAEARHAYLVACNDDEREWDARRFADP